MTCEILYDRSDRSKGVAFVTYASERDARDAIREFDGANAYGQPIKMTMIPAGPAVRGRGGRNPFDTATRPAGRSLFDRIDDAGPRTRRRRSESPVDRRANMKPAPDYIDRYVPGQARSQSPRPRGTRGGVGRRPGVRRDDSARRERDSKPATKGRPRKTAEELDAEMADYWGGNENDAAGEQKTAVTTGTSIAAPAAQTTVAVDEDIDMIE